MAADSIESTIHCNTACKQRTHLAVLDLVGRSAAFGFDFLFFFGLPINGGILAAGFCIPGPTCCVAGISASVTLAKAGMIVPVTGVFNDDARFSRRLWNETEDSGDVGATSGTE